ncbi:MAG: WYL domain-containing protein [Planctomycetes bacterium]|nr:WYL domain-containing protein [Planctomycetota bacterium]
MLRLIQVLQSGRSYAVDDLADSLRVSRRTLFRDLNLLAEAGITYRFDAVTRRYSTDRVALLPPVALSHAEALALMIAARHALRQPFMPDPGAASSAGMKIESMLPQAMQDYCGPLLDGVGVRLDRASDPEAVRNAIPVLQLALSKHSPVWVEYDSYADDRLLEFVIHPYRLIYLQQGWYLIGYAESSEAVRTFKVERIRGIKVLHRPYRADARFNLDEYLGNAWQVIRGDRRYHVRIRFEAKVAGCVAEIRWHKTQRTTPQEDGSLLFEADVDGVDEIAWWVLGYGDQARVLEPAALRRIVAGHARRMLDYYLAAADPVA